MNAKRVTIGIVLLAFATCLPADEGKELYELRYGEQREKVDATADKADDVALAAEHLTDIAKYADYKALVKIMLEQAYELAMRDKAGYETAAKAAELLLEKFPDDRAAWLDKAIRIQEIQYRSGGAREAAGQKLIGLYLDAARVCAGKEKFAAAFKHALKAYKVAAAVKSDRKEAILGTRRYYQARRDLKASPDDAALRASAIRICLVEMDDPAEAAGLLNATVDEATRTCVSLAAGNPGQVPEADCLKLATWYLELARKASKPGKIVCGCRAETYLKRYLALHVAKDAARLKAELLLDKAEKGLAAAGGAAAKRAGVAPTSAPASEEADEEAKLLAAEMARMTDLLNKGGNWKAIRGKWKKGKGRFVGSGNSNMKFLHELPGDCILEFTMTVLSGIRPRVLFKNGVHIGTEGFQPTIHIHGKGAKQKKGKAFPYKHRMPMRVRVIFKGETIELQINGKKVATAKRTAVTNERVNIQAGDKFSKGTVAFADFKVSPLGTPPETGPGAVAAKPEPEPKTEEGRYYKKLVDAYMSEKWAEVSKQVSLYPKYVSRLSLEQRKDVTYIRQTAPLHRPAWWKHCKSNGNITFTAKIWNRSFKANYVPSAALGAQGVVEIRNGRLMSIVTWQPQLVDNPERLEGERGKAHKLVKGHLAECIIWHELGHNYITEFLPAQHVIELYQNYTMLFRQLQEFYADMTALYHAGSKGRRCQLFIRLGSLSMNYENDSHMRAAYGIGAIFLAEWLADPEHIDKKWPHIHLPGKMPKKDIERNVLIYIYDKFDPRWSLAEDRQLRELVRRALVTRKPGQRYTEGERILRTKGTIELANNLKYRLMPADDRPHKTKRDAWVKQQLQKAIKAGKADKPVKDSRTPYGRPYIRMIIP